MTPERAIQTLLRQDFVSFLHKVFNTVAPGETFRANWHIEAIAHELMNIRDGKTTRLIINQPPRTLKSIATSVALPAFLLGHDPSFSVICVSYSSELATDLHRQFRMVIDAPWYRELFLGFRVKKDRDMELKTTRGGGRIATSVGGTLTGRGANLIIVDDPQKAEEAQSETARKRVIDWYSNTLVSRLNDQRTGSIVVVMQRLHEDDLAGHLRERGGWQHLDLPAIAPETRDVELCYGQIHNWVIGELLDAERLSLPVLERMKREIGSFMYSAQYLQQPIPAEGNMILRDWLRFTDKVPERGAGIKIVQSWDLASSASETADYTVCTTWIVQRQFYYLIDVQRMRCEFPEVNRRFYQLAELHKPHAILVEKAGPGLTFLQGLWAQDHLPFVRPIGIKPEGSKIDRMSVESPKLEAGQVMLLKDAVWSDTLLNELLAFPGAKHDDQVDSISQFLKWIGSRGAQERLSSGFGWPM